MFTHGIGWLHKGVFAMTIDMQAQGVLRDLYQKFDERLELSISAPDYDQMQIDYLIKAGLLTKIDTSTLSGWAYIVRPTYEGKVYLSQLRETPASKLQEFIQRGEEIGKKEYHPAERGFAISFVSGPLYKLGWTRSTFLTSGILKTTRCTIRFFRHIFTGEIGHLPMKT